MTETDMTERPQLNSKLLAKLACPECHGDLAELEEELFCLKCGQKYAIENGIPILISRDSMTLQRPIDHASNT